MPQSTDYKLDDSTLFQPSRMLNEDEQSKHEDICEDFEDIWLRIKIRIPEGAAMEIVKQRLVEAKFWANYALVHGDTDE
jgi:hypothetical protein